MLSGILERQAPQAVDEYARVCPDLAARVWRVDDMVRLKPFGGASNWTSVVFLQKGAPTEYPVRYVKWKPDQECQARPVDPARPASPWIVVPTGEQVAAAGPSDYQAHAGAYSGGANGVYWLRIVGRDGANLVVENLHDCGKRAQAERASTRGAMSSSRRPST